MPILTVPKVLRDRLGDEGVEALITLLNEAAHHERNNLLGILEERFERRVAEEGNRLHNHITEEVAKLEAHIAAESARLDNRITEEVTKLTQQITEVETRLQQQIAHVNDRITTEMARMGERIAGVRADLIRWMFLFWVGQIGVLIAMLVAFLR
ncbi:MAG: DUF1640 domain-containing protein [Rhodothermus sp.]|nr:DUF1640 domain-containing protein [Rhodothermus sp.]